MHPPVMDFNVPLAQPGETHRPPSPRTISAFNAALPHAQVFAQNTVIHGGSSSDPSFGMTTPRQHPAPPLVELNAHAHNNGQVGNEQNLRTAQTALHELVVHAQYDAVYANGTAVQEHQRMFANPARSASNSYLAATRSHIRGHAGDQGAQQSIIDDYDRDVRSELADPANHVGMSPQALTGARTYHRNRVNSMTDAIAPQPQQRHTW